MLLEGLELFIHSNEQRYSSVALLNRIKEEELSAFEKVVLNQHRGVIILLREIIIDNDLTFGDIMPDENSVEDNLFMKCFDPYMNDIVRSRLLELLNRYDNEAGN